MSAAGALLDLSAEQQYEFFDTLMHLARKNGNAFIFFSIKKFCSPKLFAKTHKKPCLALWYKNCDHKLYSKSSSSA